MSAHLTSIDSALQRLMQAMSRLFGIKPSLASLLSLLTIVTLLPPLVFGGWLFQRNVTERREGIEQRLSDAAASISAAVDREMHGWRETAEVAAAAVPLRPDQFANFHAWAAGLTSKVDGHFILIDKSGQQFVNTRFPFGSALPGFSDEATLTRVYETGQPINSNITMDRSAKRPVFAIHVPVKQGGVVLYSFVYSPSLVALQRIVARHSLPSGWVAAIVDGNGVLAAGSFISAQSVVGSPISAQWQQLLTDTPIGITEFEIPGEIPALVGHRLSTSTGWRAVVSAPIALLERPSDTIRLAGLMFVGGILFLSFGAAILTSTLIRRPMHHATAAALALASGVPIAPKRTFMAETEVLGAALSTAAREIEERRVALEESEARARNFVNAAPAILWAVSPQKAFWVSDRWYEYTGLSSPMPLRGWSEHLHPEDRARCRQDWRLSIAGGTELRSQARIRGKDGAYRWFQLQTMPQRDAAGCVVMWYGSAADIDDQKRIEQSLADSEERLRLAQEIAGLGSVEWNLLTDRGRWSATFANLFGLDVDGWEGQSGDAVLVQIATRASRSEFEKFSTLREELRTQREFTREFQFAGPDGAPRWLLARGVVIEGEDHGRRLIAVAQDVTRRKLDEIDRARFIAVAEASREAIIGTSLSGRIEVWNKAAERLYGWTVDEIKDKSAAVIDLPDASVDITDLIERASMGQRIGPLDATHRMRNGHPVEINMSIVPVRDWQGEVIGLSISARDVGARKRREAQARWVMRELSHRSRNLLAIVQSIAGQTALSSPSLELFQSRFSDRLAALSRSHDLLVGQQWRGALLSDLVASQVMPFIPSEPQRLTVRGPAQMLKPEATQSLGMALHELAHNAAKHGALSLPNGKIEVSWDIFGGAVPAETTIAIVWRESGGTIEIADHPAGFGQKIIERLTPSAVAGSSTIEWTPEGLIWRLTAPLFNVAQGVTDVAAEHAAFDFGSSSRELMQLYRVWSDLRSGRRLPSFTDLVASEIGRHEAVFVAVEVGDDATDLKIMKVGGRLAEMLGGSAPEVMATSPLGRALAREFIRCRETVLTANPCYFCIGTEGSASAMTHEVLVVPVSSGGDVVSHFVGMVLPIEA